MLIAYLVLLCEFFWEFSIFHFCRPPVDIYWHPLWSSVIYRFIPSFFRRYSGCYFLLPGCKWTEEFQSGFSIVCIRFAFHCFLPSYLEGCKVCNKVFWVMGRVTVICVFCWDLTALLAFGSSSCRVSFFPYLILAWGVWEWRLSVGIYYYLQLVNASL